MRPEAVTATVLWTMTAWGVQLLAALRAMFAKNCTQITSEQVVQELLADANSQPRPRVLPPAAAPERKRKEKEKAFERLISLPSGQHQTRLAELAKRFDEPRSPFHNEIGVPIVRVGRREFECIGAIPPQDHPQARRLAT